MKQRRILRKKEVRRRTGYSDTTIWRRERQGTFPARVQLSEHSVGWYEDEIDALDPRPDPRRRSASQTAGRSRSGPVMSRDPGRGPLARKRRPAEAAFMTPDVGYQAGQIKRQRVSKAEIGKRRAQLCIRLVRLWGGRLTGTAPFGVEQNGMTLDALRWAGR